MEAQPDFRIARLEDVPGAIAVLERWFVEAWEPWYGPNGQGDAKADLTASLGRDKLPICLLVLNGDNKVLATASLKDASVGSELGVGPWLATVLVRQEHRGKGIGTLLVGAIEDEAIRLGYTTIYTSTDTAMGIVERRGWTKFGATSSIRGPLAIYRWTAA